MDDSLNNNFYVGGDEYWQHYKNFSEFSDVMSPDQIKNLSLDDKVKIFNKFVFLVNIELSTYCNRKCTYCPMSMYNRKQQYMSEELLQKIISQLKEVDYKAGIVLNFFNEPLLDVDLIEKIKYIRKNLPNAYILFNSNGDFLTRELLENFFSVGLNLIIVTLHTNPEKEYIDFEKRSEMFNFLNKMNLSEYFDERSEIEGKNITLKISFSRYRQLNILCNNWQIYGNDRGGVLTELSKEVRDMPCKNPFREIYIKYDGTITPCCNIYFNLNPIYGNLNSDSIIDIYFSKNMIEFRKKLFSFSPKTGYCAFCNTPDNSNVESKETRDYVLKML